MGTVTHAVLPVLAAAVVLRDRRPDWLMGRSGWIVIGVAGALPDLLSPHLSIDSRLNSWSHGLPFWCLLSLLLLLACAVIRERWNARLALSASGAYGLHLLCDGISGGINLFHPFRTLIWGDYWVSPIYWIPLDITCVLACYWIFRLRPLWRMRGKHREPHNAAAHRDADDGSIS